jgi:hypothetical protein
VTLDTPAEPRSGISSGLREGWHMIVVTRNGKTTVITGWRAWLIGVAISLAATAFLFVIAFVMLGVAISVGAVLLIVVPVVVGVAILASLFRRQE